MPFDSGEYGGVVQMSKQSAEIGRHAVEDRERQLWEMKSARHERKACLRALFVGRQPTSEDPIEVSHARSLYGARDCDDCKLAKVA